MDCAQIGSETSKQDMKITINSGSCTLVFCYLIKNQSNEIPNFKELLFFNLKSLIARFEKCLPINISVPPDSMKSGPMPESSESSERWRPRSVPM